MGGVVLTLDSESGRHRARVFQTSAGVYRVEAERLTEAMDAGGYKRGEFWAAVPGFVSYTDTVERAEQLAAEKLLALEPPPVS
jgi:hypothetical protein